MVSHHEATGAVETGRREVQDASVAVETESEWLNSMLQNTIVQNGGVQIDPELRGHILEDYADGKLSSRLSYFEQGETLTEPDASDYRTQTRPGWNESGGGGTVSLSEATQVDHHTTQPLRRAYNEVMDPSAVYVSSEDKTFHVYHVGTDAYARHYDHAAGSWSSEYLVDSGDYDDQHGAPVLTVDGNGIIHVWFNSHGPNASSHYIQSDNAYDVSSWTVQSTDFQADNGVYKKVTTLSGTIYIFDPIGSLSNGRPERLYQSGDGGTSWSSQDIIDFTANTKSIYNHKAIPVGSKIHLFWRVWNENAQVMEKAMYAYWETSDGTLRDINGNQLTTPLDETTADDQCLIFDEGTTDIGNGIGIASMDVDSNDIPYVTWTVPDPNSTDVLIKWSYWDGTQWTSPSTIVATSSRHDGGDLDAKSATDIDLYATINSRQEIHRFNWDGSSWVDVETIQTAGDYDLFAPQPVRPAHSDMRVIWSEDTGDRTINSKTFAYGDSGLVQDGTPGHVEFPSTTGSVRLDTGSSVSRGTWEFTFQFGSPSGSSDFWLHTDTPTDPNSGSGYYVRFFDSSASNPLRLSKRTNGSATDLVAASWPADGAEHTVTVTRDDSDNWEILIDGSSKGTATDGEHDVPHITVEHRMSTTLQIKSAKVY